MERRSFVKAIFGFAGAVAAVPALAKHKAAGKAALLLPNDPVVGEYIQILYVGGNKWAVLGNRERWEIKQL